MKLLKEKVDKGYIISVVVGSKVYSSWWTAPPIYGVDKNNSYHFDMEYLKNRYPIINTRKRAEQFSELYKNLWIEVSDYQMDLMKHCIGLGRSKKPYRNYFFTQEGDKDWNVLVEKGLAVKGTKHPNNDEFVYFWLSKRGVEFVLGKSIGEAVYKEL